MTISSSGSLVGKRATTVTKHCSLCCHDDNCNHSCKGNTTTAITKAVTTPTWSTQMTHTQITHSTTTLTTSAQLGFLATQTASRVIMNSSHSLSGLTIMATAKSVNQSRKPAALSYTQPTTNAAGFSTTMTSASPKRKTFYCSSTFNKQCKILDNANNKYNKTSNNNNNNNSNTVRLYSIAHGKDSCFILQKITGRNCVTLIVAVL